MTTEPSTGSTSQLLLDEASIEALRERLYPELEKAIRASVRRALFGELAEQPIPLYYDRFIVSEIRRLEEAIERNGERIAELKGYIDERTGELREYIDQRIGELREHIDQRLTNVDTRLNTIETRLIEQREDIFRYIDRTAFWTRVMNGVVLALLAALIAKLLLG
jgi:ribosome-associated translation inhibitor RaiA